jgi:hypothetical protein
LTEVALKIEPVLESCALRIASSAADISWGLIDADPTISLETSIASGELEGAVGEDAGVEPVLAVPPQPAARPTQTTASINIGKRTGTFLMQSLHSAPHRL